MQCLENFAHPLFLYQGFSYDEQRQVAVDPSALVSTNELALHMGLPRHSVQGLPVLEHAPFAQEVVLQQGASQPKTSDDDKETGIDNIYLGKLCHLGERTSAAVELNAESLSMHTFITGSTGSGKSNAVYHLLAELRKKGKSFLVVEPAKVQKCVPLCALLWDESKDRKTFTDQPLCISGAGACAGTHRPHH